MARGDTAFMQKLQQRCLKALQTTQIGGKSFILIQNNKQ